jgi:type IV secretory pathway VirB3-like protein
MAAELEGAPVDAHDERVTATWLVAASLVCSVAAVVFPWGVLAAIAAIVVLVLRARSASDQVARRLLWAAVVPPVLAVAFWAAATFAFMGLESSVRT